MTIDTREAKERTQSTLAAVCDKLDLEPSEIDLLETALVVAFLDGRISAYADSVEIIRRTPILGE